MEFDSPPPLPVGNHRLATQIAYDSTLSIYRSFTVLNTRNLLYLQTELATLEDRLLRLDNRANDLNEWSLPRSWRAMRYENGEMWTTAMEVRKLLEMYNQALQAQAWLHSLRRPTPRARDALAKIIAQGSTSDLDREYITLDHRDLISLCPDIKNEILTKLLEKHFYKHFRTPELEPPDSPFEIYSQSRIRSVVRVLAIIVSSSLPILSIIALYHIHSEGIRLSLIVVFTALCSTFLAFLTSATNIEIIAATSTYTAVLVVFVSGNLTSNV